MPGLFLPQYKFMRTLLVVCMVAVVFGASTLPGFATAQTDAPLEAATIEVAKELPIDSDGDGITDDDEVSIYGTNPLLADTDGDGIADDDEVSVYGTNPLLADTDGDGLTDGDEISVYGTNPLLADTDGDGMTDHNEVSVYGTNPLLADTDGDGASDGVEIANGTDPLAAPIPTPTPTPVQPTPTPVPTTQVPTVVPPTPTPTPVTPTLTPVPPTQAPTAVPPTPTPVPPTQAPTAVPPTPTPVSPTPTPVPPTPVSPTPAPTPNGNFSVQRVISGSGCTQGSSTDIVPAGTAVEFRCEGESPPFFGSVTRSFTGLTPGWQYQVNDGPWRDAVGSDDVRQGSTLSAFTVRLRPTTAVNPGSQGAITITVEARGLFGTLIRSYTTTLGATRQISVPTAADLQLVCNPVSISTAVNAAQIVNCTYSGRSSLGTRQITLTRITVPAPAGWTITGPVGSVSGRTLTIVPSAPITYGGQSYTFSYTLTPGCTAPTTAQPLNLTSTFSFNSTSGIAGATITQQATRLNTSSLAVAISSNSLVWNEGYSLTDTTVSGSLMYSMVANGCSGWNIQVSASPFKYIGPNNGTSIPASNLRLTATGNPIVISGEGTGVSRQTSTGPINTPLRVMNATVGTGNGTYQQPLGFDLTIPGRSVVGTYQSTITVTSAAAP